MERCNVENQERNDVIIIADSFYFNWEWYVSQYNLKITNKMEAAQHYLFEGWKLSYNPSLYFATDVYLILNQDVKDSGMNPLLHYEKFGVDEKRNIEVVKATSNTESRGIDDVFLIMNSTCFNWKWYVDHYNLKITNQMEAAKHYLNIGWKLYYDPSPDFVSSVYLALYWDVKTANINPLLHYEKFGREEGRKIGDIERIKEEYDLVKNSDYFDEKWYRSEYGIGDKIDAVYYFLYNGIGDNPSMSFSSLDYLTDNMRQIEESQNPLVHYEKNKNSNNNLILKETNNKINLENCEIVNQVELKRLEKYNNRGVKAHTKSVDIIICVHNAYEYVKQCIQSVIENTTKPYHIIIVDDNSTQETVSYLEEVAQSNNDIELIKNQLGLHGYTYTANIGLRGSTADYCVMLNSDTIVSAHWLDNMVACAESENVIGIVGPLSNTASWQSVPRLAGVDGDWCHNTIPEDFSISDVARMVEYNSKRIYPKVPLLNGFCLMIKRQVIDKIGYFDEEHFGRGFGEEDDYNTRAIKAGFDLAIAEDTYVFHAQSKSYTDEKRLELCRLSGEILRKKHGKEYIDNCVSFMETNRVLDSIRRRVEIMFEKEQIYRKSKKLYQGKKILFLLSVGSAGGGANVIIQESNALLRMGVEVTFLNLESNHNEYNKAYRNLNISVIWIRNFVEFNYDIAKDYDAVVCTSFRTVEYCKFLEEYEKPKVIYYIQDYEPYFIPGYLEGKDYDYSDYKKAVDSYTLISNCINITKTQWNYNEVKRHTGAKCIVIGPSLNTNLFMPRLPEKNGKLVITAMIRPSTKQRGAQMTFDVLRELAHEYKSKVGIWIFGIDPEHDSNSKFFFFKQKKDFEFINYGITTPEIIANILAESDIFLDLSEYQAMGLTAMEAMACGCAVIVPQKGGTDCFAKDGINCLTVNTLDFKECINSAKKLIDDRCFCKKIGRQAYRDMIEMYPEKAAVKFLEAIFDKRIF